MQLNRAHACAHAKGPLTSVASLAVSPSVMRSTGTRVHDATIASTSAAPTTGSGLPDGAGPASAAA